MGTDRHTMRRTVAFIVTAFVVLAAPRWVFANPEQGWRWVLKMLAVAFAGAAVYTLIVDAPTAARGLLHRPPSQPR